MRPYPTARLARLSTTAPEPVTLAEAKLHCRVDGSTEDSLLTALITAGREYCEALTGCTLISTSWRLELSRFPDAGGDIIIPRSAVAAISSMTYIADDASTVTMTSGTDFRLVTGLAVARIRKPVATATEAWPITLPIEDAVRVTFTAGTTVPTAAKQAILLLVGHWYANREAEVVGSSTNSLNLTVRALLDAVRVGEVMP